MIIKNENTFTIRFADESTKELSKAEMLELKKEFIKIKITELVEKKNKKEKPLSVRQLKILSMLDSGSSQSDCSRLLNISRQAVFNNIKTIEKRGFTLNNRSLKCTK